MKIEKLQFGHRELFKKDPVHGDRTFKGQTTQVEYFSPNNEFVNVLIKHDGPIDITTCTANGPMAGLAISADLEQGVMRMEQKQEAEGIVTIPVQVQGNPYRRDPWLQIILYVTEHECYEPVQKVTLEGEILYTFQILHV